MGEAPFRVTSLRASEPNVAGKETLVEDLLYAKPCALLLHAGMTSTLCLKQPEPSLP